MRRRGFILAVASLIVIGGIVVYLFRTTEPLQQNKHRVKKASVKSSAEPGKSGNNPELINSIISQQQKSREGFRRLAEGQVEEIKFNGPAKGDNKQKQLTVTVRFVDGTNQNYSIFFVADGKYWVLTQLVRDGGSEIRSSIPTLTKAEDKLGDKMLELQRQSENQEDIAEALAGNITRLEFGNLTPGGDNKVIINATAFHNDGRQTAAKVDMEQLHGYWYATGVRKGES